MKQDLKNYLAHIAEKEIQQKLSARKPKKIDEPGLKPSAVLVPLVREDEGWQVLFTQRSNKVGAHKGEISFPGGVVEQGENPLQAMLREVEEELGVEKEKIAILGELDEIFTITGFRIKPYVGILKTKEFAPNPDEIDRVLIIPIKNFLDPSRLKVEHWSRKGADYPVYFFELDEAVVWGATAKILKNFLEILLGKKFEDL